MQAAETAFGIGGSVKDFGLDKEPDVIGADKPIHKGPGPLSTMPLYWPEFDKKPDFERDPLVEPMIRPEADPLLKPEMNPMFGPVNPVLIGIGIYGRPFDDVQADDSLLAGIEDSVKADEKSDLSNRINIGLMDLGDDKVVSGAAIDGAAMDSAIASRNAARMTA